MSRLARFSRLSRFERRLVLQALVLLPTVEARIRLGGLRRARAALERLPIPLRAHSRDHAQQIARVVHASARHGPWRTKCLATSLALQWMLRKHGLQSELRIGVRGQGRDFEAHAWVEHDGVALLEPRVHERFRAFRSFGGRINP